MEIEKLDSLDYSIHGSLGSIITLYNFGLNIQNEEYKEIALSKLQNVFSTFNNSEVKYNGYSNGLISLGALTQHLITKENVHFDDFDSTISIIDEVAMYNGANLLKANNLDFIAGATGVGFYFIDRIGQSKFAKKYIDDWVKNVEVNVHNKNGKVQLSIFDSYLKLSKKKDFVNLGLGHGLPSILKLLVLCLEKGIDEVLPIIKNILKFFLQIKPSETNSFIYPHVYAEGEKAEKVD